MCGARCSSSMISLVGRHELSAPEVLDALKASLKRDLGELPFDEQGFLDMADVGRTMAK